MFLQSKHLFLTYPQCNVSPAEALEEISKILATWTVEKYVIAQENHQDGSKHLHMYLGTKKQCNIRTATSLDLNGHHGNYQRARSVKDVIAYVTKDGNYISNFDVSAPPKKGTRELIGKRISAGEDLNALVQEYPQLIFGYNRLKEDIKSWKVDNEVPHDDTPFWLPNPWGLLLPHRVQKKQRHYWIYSTQPSKGKTTQFAQPIESKYRGRICTGELTYWPVRKSDDVVILDDYNTARLKFCALNQMCDGTYQYRLFMAGTIRLESPTIVILSNASLRDLYPFMFALLEARFKTICVDNLYAL